MAYLFMEGKLRLGLNQAWWPYVNASYPKDVTNFGKEVAKAIIEIRKLKGGEAVVQRFQKLSFKVDIIKTKGDGFFLPIHAGLKQMVGAEGKGATQFDQNLAEVGGVIVWDPKRSFSHSNTQLKNEVSYPSYVLLCHEMGHAIQVDEAGGRKGTQQWHQNYQKNTEKVEMDNISRHESPLVKELGLAPRIKYK